MAFEQLTPWTAPYSVHENGRKRSNTKGDFIIYRSLRYY